MVDSVEEAIEALRELKSDVIAIAPDDRKALSNVMVRFSRLERAAMDNLASDTVDAEGRARVFEAIRAVRETFGQPVPDPLPMEPADPHPWQTEG